MSPIRSLVGCIFSICGSRNISIITAALLSIIVCLASIVSLLDVYFHENIYRVMHDDASGLTTAPNILFLGDSSLGNAVNLNLAADQLDAKSLPLSGLYGVAGALGLYNDIKARENIRQIVLVFSFDFFVRDFSNYGAFKTWGFETFFSSSVDYVQVFNRSVNISERIGLLLSRLVAEGLHYSRAEQDLIRRHGYYPQSSLDGKLEPRTVFTATDINDRKIDELRTFIDALPSDIQVTFAFGPYFKESIIQSRSYIEAVLDLLASLDVTYINAYEMEDAMVGDSSFHIAPEFQSASTQHYLSQLNVLD